MPISRAPSCSLTWHQRPHAQHNAGNRPVVRVAPGVAQTVTARPGAKLRIVFVLSVLILVLGVRPFGAATPLDLAATLLAIAAWQSTFALAAWALSGESRICVDREGITVVQHRRFRVVRQACTWPEVCATKYRV